tara:strand:- start:4004 stop:5101 length:1098 start_codon:yes stop_codon:yes gene_type:complete
MNFPRAVWVGSHFDNQIGFPRKIVNNQREYINLIKKYNNKMNCYTTIYDFERYRYKDGEANIPDETSVILDRAFLDFDSHGNPMSWSFEDMCNVSKYLMSNNYKFDMLFSGKGFHIHVYGLPARDIRQIQTFYYQMVDVCKNAREKPLPTKNGTTLDRAGIKTNGLRRIANTVNLSSENYYYVIPLSLDDLNEGLNHILQEAQKPRIKERYTYGETLVEWPSVLPISLAPVEVAKVENICKLPMLPCLYNAIMVENPTHESRVYLIQWWRSLLAGEGIGEKKHIQEKDKPTAVETIMGALKEIVSHEDVWLDWDERKTRRYVRGIVDGQYSAPGCLSKLIPQGYCVGKCWRYPSAHEGGIESIVY